MTNSNHAANLRMAQKKKEQSAMNDKSDKKTAEETTPVETVAQIVPGKNTLNRGNTSQAAQTMHDLAFWGIAPKGYL